jgi:hypothetical protein
MFMSQSLDQFLNRRRSVKYSCLELADEVWFELTGLHLKKRLKRLTAAFAAATKAVNSSGFELLRTPISPCFVLMQRDKITPHIGIYVDGSIFHLAEHGAEYRPVQIATLGFNKIGYYR